jgi:hypothetical protein
MSDYPKYVAEINLLFLVKNGGNGENRTLHILLAKEYRQPWNMRPHI